MCRYIYIERKTFCLLVKNSPPLCVMSTPLKWIIIVRITTFLHLTNEQTNRADLEVVNILNLN